MNLLLRYYKFIAILCVIIIIFTLGFWFGYEAGFDHVIHEIEISGATR